MVSGGPLAKQTPVRAVTRFNVPIIDPNMPLAILAWKYMDNNRDQAFPVMQEGVLVGMVALAHIDHIPRLEWGRHKVGAHMLPREKLVMVRTFDDIQTALAALDGAKLDHALVFDTEGFVGMLNRRDIVYRT
jgi:predicted transcriptional regulator